MSCRGLAIVAAVLAGCLVILLALWMPAAAAVDATPSSAALPRRAFLGVNAEPAPDNHVRVGKIVANSAAARSELAPGDILLALNGAPVESLGTFLTGVRSLRSGDHLVYRVRRGGTEMDIAMTLGEWPREQPAGIEVVYDAVDTPDATVRSILTMPLGNARKLPAILFVQGWDCGSVDWPFPGPNLARELVYGLTRAGFAVMRSEKSGVGDSTGTPCRDVDFRSEVALFTSALKKLKSYDFVEAGKVFIFGHSAGGWIAPLVASEEPVNGIVAYGTVVRPFAEYLVENYRRNRWRRSQRDLVQLEDEQRLYARLLHHLLVEKSSVRDVTAQHPDLSAIAKTMFPDEEYFDGWRTLQHVRQLNDQNLARAWAALDIPVLALIGEFDVRTLPMDQEYIAAIVNARHPGKGSWRLLPKMDHGFALHESLQESVAHEFAGPFGEQVVQETLRWIQAQ